MSIEESKAKYLYHAHRMQGGVGIEQANPDNLETTAKHLRVGINSAMSDQSGLVRLLIAKGIFSEEEYYESIADRMEEEANSYEEQIQARLGKKVKLGSMY